MTSRAFRKRQPLTCHHSVGVPCAVAVQQVLNGTLSERGILAPMNGKINGPLIKELKEKYGIFCKEEIL